MSWENILQQQPRQVLTQLDLVFIGPVLVLQQEFLTAAELILEGRGRVSPPASLEIFSPPLTFTQNVNSTLCQKGFSWKGMNVLLVNSVFVPERFLLCFLVNFIMSKVWVCMRHVTRSN